MDSALPFSTSFASRRARCILETAQATQKVRCVSVGVKFKWSSG